MADLKKAISSPTAEVLIYLLTEQGRMTFDMMLDGCAEFEHDATEGQIRRCLEDLCQVGVAAEVGRTHSTNVPVYSLVGRWGAGEKAND